MSKIRLCGPFPWIHTMYMYMCVHVMYTYCTLCILTPLLAQGRSLQCFITPRKLPSTHQYRCFYFCKWNRPHIKGIVIDMHDINTYINCCRLEKFSLLAWANDTNYSNVHVYAKGHQQRKYVCDLYGIKILYQNQEAPLTSPRCPDPILHSWEKFLVALQRHWLELCLIWVWGA